MRPFDTKHDLLQLADLIEVAFGSELARSTNRIVADLRHAARIWPVLSAAHLFSIMPPPLISGYVWTADERLVGNVTFTCEDATQQLWTISNVAVHPDHRGQRIARQLMEAALDQVRDKGARCVALQVQTGNMPAQQLYRELGFHAYDTTTELILPKQEWHKRSRRPSLPLRKRRPDDWQELCSLFTEALPAKAQAVRPISAHQFRWGIERRVERWLADLVNRQQRFEWVLEQHGTITGLLQATGQHKRAAHRLQIAVHPDNRGAVEEELLAAGLDALGRFPHRDIESTISTSHPEALRAFHQAGFKTIRALDQMALDLSRPSQRP